MRYWVQIPSSAKENKRSFFIGDGRQDPFELIIVDGSIFLLSNRGGERARGTESQVGQKRKQDERLTEIDIADETNCSASCLFACRKIAADHKIFLASGALLFFLTYVMWIQYM